MRPRIAIPLPHGGDPEYALRAIPQYERAVELSGGEPVRIPLDRPPAEVMKQIEQCDGVLLPGSKADVDPAKFGAEKHPKTEAADPKRDTVDELLLQDAYNMRKPILGICYGLQILNVYQSGNLLQHIESVVNHEAGRKVAIAHQVAIDPASKLAKIIGSAPSIAGGSVESDDSRVKTLEARTRSPVQGSACASSGARESTAGGREVDPADREGTASSRAERDIRNEASLAAETPLIISANSSHHQAAGDVIGDGLRVVARCLEDGIIEAIEGTSAEHFVIAVQWHPERSFDDDVRSRLIFQALIRAARHRHVELTGEFEATL